MIYLIWCPEKSESEDDAKEFQSTSAAAAAKQWAERGDSEWAGYEIVCGETATVMVREKGKSSSRKFKVFGEKTAKYSAYEVE